ncbi:MAG: FHA domain-containing protein, partial [Planctomycetota bacterium]|nr:FHA domain-containing protein [Planctomycetota bacterium]
VEQKNVTVDDHEYFQRVRNDAYRGVLIDAGGVRGFDYLGNLSSSGSESGMVIPQCTPLYSPPEVISEPHFYSPSMDVYAAALSIYTLITGHVPYSHTERKIDPSDLVSVWEFKLAEKRGEISPISEDAIHRVFFPDCEFRNGSSARDEFNQSLFSFLDHYSSADPQDRGDIHTMLDDFSKLFRFVSTGKDDKDVSIPGMQGMFSSESSLARLFEAPGTQKSKGKIESVRLKRDSGLVPAVESSESIKNKLAKKRAEQPPIAQRPKSTVRLRRRPSQDNLLSSPSSEGAPQSPMAPPQTSPKIVTPETGRFSRAKALAEMERNPGQKAPKNKSKTRPQPSPTRRSAKPPASKRRPTDAPGPKRSSLPPPPKSKELEKKALESQKAVVDSLFSRAKRKSKNRVVEGGKTLDQFIKEAEKGREPYFQAFPFPVLYLDETESRPSKQDAETEQVLCTLHPPESPCVFPLSTSSGKAARCVSVGRSQERDIRINAPSISKLHAAFSLSATRKQWMMSDLGSTNESWVNSRKLEPLVPALLENHNRVVLGGESFIYFTAEGFYSYLSSIEKNS